ncbi:hypothetical protein CL619_03325 [archaeon]|nr:hypothetical protein [archaeon]|tara:strand:- start:8660 stop:11128 length:2469 start_codon:yes stop_codon:yes gene_type:complete
MTQQDQSAEGDEANLESRLDGASPIQPGQNGTYSVMFIGDPHNNLQGLRMARQVAESQGVDTRICLGDILQKLSSDYTRDQGLITERARAQLRVDSPLREALKEGKYSQAQIDMITSAAAASEATVSKHADRTYSLTREIDPNLITIGGNWDREEEIQRIFGDNYRGTGFTQEDNGMKVLWASGGGSAPVGGAGTTRGFLCDNQQEGVNRARPLQSLLANPRAEDQEGNEIDLLVTHVAPPSEGKHKDNFSVYLHRFMSARKSVGLPMPKLLVNGHHHSASATIDWINYQDDETGAEFKQLTFTPGVLAIDHAQEGSHGAFCIGEFDSQTHQLVGASEYHVQRTLSGTMRVVLYGKHTLDHAKQKVKFEEIGTVVAEETLEDIFGNRGPLKELDLNYALSDKGFNVDYTGLNAQEFDQRFRLNFSLIREYGEQSKNQVKAVLDEVRNKWDLERAAEGIPQTASYSAADLRGNQEEVMQGLAVKAAEVFGIDPKTFDELDETAREFKIKQLVQAAFGISFRDIEDATKNASLKFEDMPYNWGSGLQKKANEHISGAAQQYVLAPIEDEQWMDVIDNVWSPLNVKRSRTLERREIYGLVGKALQAGILSEEELTATSAYSTVKDFKKGTIMTDDEIKGTFDIRYANEDDLGISKRNGIPASEAAGLQKLIDEQGVPVLRNAKGDYIVTPKGIGYLDDDLKEAVNYDPIRLSDLLDSGKAKLVSQGDDYLASVGQAMYPINLEEEGITKGQYEATPLWQVLVEQEALKKNGNKAFMERLAQDSEFREALARQQDVSNGGSYSVNGGSDLPSSGPSVDMPDLPSDM